MKSLTLLAVACYLGWQIVTASQIPGNPWQRVAAEIQGAAKP